MKRNKPSRSINTLAGALSSTAIGMGLLTWGGVAAAQSAPAPSAAASGVATTPVAAAAAESVTIIGSRSRNRTVFDTMAPVDLFSAKDVDKALVSGDVGQALQSLSPSINMPHVSASGTSDSVRGIQLRGLQPDQVLVLVNGKRRHASAVLDLEGLFKGDVPVDLNTIPAGAIDHIEVLRDGAGAQYGSDAIAGVVNIVLKNAPSGGSVNLSVGAYHSPFKPTGKTITDGQNVQLNVDDGTALGETGFLRYGGGIQKSKGTNRAGAGGDYSDNGTAADEAQVGKVLYKSGDPDVEAGNLFYNGAIDLPSGIRLYSFSTLSKRNTTGAAFYRWPGDATNVASVYPNGYLPKTTNSSVDASLVAGGSKQVGDVSLDVSVRHGQNDFDYGVKNSLNSSLGAASPTRFHLADFVARQTALNFDGNWATTLPDVRLPINLAFGAEVMHDAFQSRPGDAASYAAGDQGGDPGAQAGPGLKPEDAVSVSRNVESLYVDSETDVTRQLLVGAAARYSHYDQFGSATTGKLATRFKLTDNVLLRGSASTSFRAPALAQQSFRFNTLNFDSTGTTLLNTALLPATDSLAQQFGASQLKPEKARNFSLGLATKFAASGAFSLDVYKIKIKDRITRTSDLNSDAVTAYLDAQGRSDIASVAFLTNGVDTTTTGLDAVLSNEWRVAVGTLNLSAALNLNRTQLDNVRSGSAKLTAIDPSLSLFDSKTLFDMVNETPKNKTILSAEWDSGADWDLSTKATRYGSIQVLSYDDSVGAIHYGAKWSIDVDAKYRVTRQLSVSVGSNNLFNQYPTRTPDSDNLYGHLPYDYTNPIGINGAYFYARAAYTF
jgi:iron complex outermembrane receptor protein